MGRALRQQSGEGGSGGRGREVASRGRGDDVGSEEAQTRLRRSVHCECNVAGVVMMGDGAWMMTAQSEVEGGWKG